MDTTLYAAYLQARHWGGPWPSPAGDALRTARAGAQASARRLAITWTRADVGKATQDGWDLTITVGYEYAPDISHLGTFSDTWRAGALVNPKWHEDQERVWGNRQRYFHYFHPENTEGAATELHDQGMHRHLATMTERGYGFQNMQEALGEDGTEHFYIFVKAGKEGYTLGTDSISDVTVTGGTTDPYMLDLYFECAQNAIAEGERTLARLKATA